MNKKKKIFEDNTPLTKDEINSYLEGNLSQSDKYTLEQKIAANEFNSDAMEGFENTSGSLEGFNKLEDQFHANLPRKFKNSNWKFGYSLTLVVGLAIGIYLIGYYYLVQSEIEKEVFDKNRIEISQQKVKSELDIILSTLIIELDDNEIETATPLEKSKQLTSEKIVVESPITIDIDSSIIQNKDSVIHIIEKEKEKIYDEIVDKSEIPPIDKAYVFVSNVKTLSLSHLLVVDYSEIYTEKISLPNFEIPTGTTADKENKNDVGLNKELETPNYKIEISYVYFLEMAQEKFWKNKFKDALKDYKIILKHYKDDANAHFYMALCYHNINKQKKAIEHFDKVEKHEYNTFHQEAAWYKALSFYELGKTSECITILNKIANANGFYATRASNMLNDI